MTQAPRFSVGDPVWVVPLRTRKRFAAVVVDREHLDLTIGEGYWPIGNAWGYEVMPVDGTASSSWVEWVLEPRNPPEADGKSLEDLLDRLNEQPA